MANALTTALPLGLSFNLATTNAGQILFITAPGGAGGVTTVFGRSGDVVAQNGDYSSSQITNNSSVPGATTKDALDRLGPACAKANVALTDADVTIATTNEQWLPAGILTAARMATITPSAFPFKAFPVNIGTQAFNYTFSNGGPELGSIVITAGLRVTVWVTSDGSNVVFTVVDLGQEPV